MQRIRSPLAVSSILILTLIGLFFTSFSSYAVTIFIYLTLAFLTVFIHEMGHLIGALYVRFQFVYLIIGPFRIEPRFKLSLNYWWVAFGGVALAVPKNLKHAREKYKYYVMGGPLASLLTAVICYISNYYIKNEYLAGMVAINLIIFTVTIIPINETDGHILLQLMKGGEMADDLFIDSLLVSEMYANKRPIDWNPQYIAMARNVSPSPERVICAYTLFYSDLMKKGYVQASNSIQCFKEIPLNNENKYALQFITHVRIIDHLVIKDFDIDYCESLFENQSKLIEPVSYNRSKAIIDYMKGHTREALELLNEIENECSVKLEKASYFEAELKLTKIIREHLTIEL